MNAWQRRRALARTTAVWAAGSIAIGAALATRADPWWRAFGRQHVGWGLVDLGIVAAVTANQSRRMARLAHPYGPAQLRRERRVLGRVLLVNVVADAGYVAGGVALWRGRNQHPRAAGAGAAIGVQGAFLLLHDAYHAYGSRG